ncbi:MAG TPA: glycosyltransferase family 1 protein [Patescibacteria group bacterium]|jgi:glycosyltransferase involved in cell wall biosynthesis|nr:glycosyltransferase family 1 protein [Patescibacteria group bacterium]
MRIGFDFRMGGSINAGIGRYSFELLSHMLKQQQDADSKDEFIVFYHKFNNNPKDLAALKKLGAQLVATSIRHYSFAEQLQLPRILNKYNLDLVHFPNFNVPVLYKRPYVVTIHDMVHHKISGHKKSRIWKFYAYQYLIQKAVDRAERILTVTEAAKDEIVKYLQVPAEKISVIYEAPAEHNITPTSTERIKEKFLLSRPYFLFVGTLERKKNIPMLAKAFDLFLTKYKFDMDLVIAGKVDQHYPEVKDQILEIEHNNRVVLTGFVEDEDQAALYKNAYAFITTSLHEGFGLPGLEAMRYGLPVLASNTPVFNEVYDNGAIYFDPLNTEDIAEHMKLVAQDTQFHAQMQDKSVNRVQYFDWDETAKQTLEVYHIVVGKTI